MRIENVYTLAMAYLLAKRMQAYYKTKDRHFAKIYAGIVYSFEERFRNLNEDIDVLAYFGESHAA